MRDAILSGMNYEEAFTHVMEKGYASERSVVGMTFTRVFSRGDLEANYQGLRFTFSLCQPDSDVRLVYDGEAWQFIDLDKFTIRDYINPDWDESWNSSIFAEKAWKEDVTRRFHELGYCDVLASDWVQKQRAYYATFTEPSTNKRHEPELLAAVFPDMQPDAHSLPRYCESLAPPAR